jgi:hypothetical protein
LGQLGFESFAETIMKTRKLRPDEINEILTPLVDFKMMEHRSFWAVKNNPRNLARDLKSSGKPMVLTYNGMVVALLCDSCVYQQTEERRRRLEALLVGVPSASTPFTPNVGRVRMQPSDQQNIQEIKRCIAQIERLEHDIMLHKSRLYDLEEQLQEISEKKLVKISGIGAISLVGPSKINKSLKT